jgi:phosphoglycolate phosphatase
MKDFKKEINTIIWDWNGTLLNDADICISCMNILLQDRNIPLLDYQRYKEIFTFPVKEYYINAGFNFEDEPFYIPAHQFIDLYREKVISSPLHKDVAEVLSYMQQKGYQQVILSAMEKEFLLQTMEGKDIIPFFSGIFGIDNHLGAGKSIAAKELMGTLKCHPDSTVIIGDTLHDAEIAEELEISCILVSQGHQSHERLEKSGNKVIHELKDLYKLL